MFILQLQPHAQNLSPRQVMAFKKKSYPNNKETLFNIFSVKVPLKWSRYDKKVKLLMGLSIFVCENNILQCGDAILYTYDSIVERKRPFPSKYEVCF